MTSTAELEFFREVSLRICGSLEIDKALNQVLVYVRDFLPADELVLVVYAPEAGAVEVVASADAAGGQLRRESTVMPEPVRAEIEAAGNHIRVRLANDVHADPILSRVGRILDWPASSVIAARLIIEGAMVGALYVRAIGTGRYTREHVRLWEMVNEPAAVALANSQRYRKAAELRDRLKDDNQYLRQELRKNASEEIIGADFGLKDVMNRVRHVAPLSSPVLLLGETGTGKELIATAIHNLSPRNSGPLVTVNCGGIPESLVDSELFGHERGAFTGASTTRRGRFERAHGGTIFLDEIGELHQQAQVRLLRVLQEKRIERVGGTAPIRVDIRIISATHRDLEKMVARGQFREDLYFRLKVFPIVLPPLRERTADIPVLVQRFIVKKAREMGLRRIPPVAPGAVDRLLDYPWPGNVRELENAVERAIILSDNNPLDFAEILGPPQSTDAPALMNADSDVLNLDELVRLHIRRVLEATGGRIEGPAGAAARLGLNPGTLRHRMRKLGIPFGRRAAGVYPCRVDGGRFSGKSARCV